ncbi:MAG: glycerophosphodiester phosphodiesterase [Spirochaetales bacterium]|nr:glycerophosphodiester phosphodiesterase [Spirochaetales bacterium]
MGKRSKGIFIGVLITLATAAAIFSIATKVKEHPFFRNTRFDVIAHAGAKGLRPENTMEAFRNAVNLGVDLLEMDIHLTKDGHVVVIHDVTVDRTTNGTGQVKELTLAEIQSLDAGYSWASEGFSDVFPYRNRGIQVPTLPEVFQAFPEVRMNVEMKQADIAIVEKLGSLIDEFDRWDTTLIASFDSDLMEEFRKKYPRAATSGGRSEIKTFYILARLYLAFLFPSPAEAFQVPEWDGDVHVITSGFVWEAHRRNIRIHVWTVNDKERMLELILKGVDGIITDRPDLLFEVLESK